MEVGRGGREWWHDVHFLPFRPVSRFVHYRRPHSWLSPALLSGVSGENTEGRGEENGMEVKGVGRQICTVEKREDDRNKRREGETVNSESKWERRQMGGWMVA